MRRQMKKTYFTLLELMISMGVFAVLMLGLMQFFTSAQNLWTKSNSTTEVFDNARIAMNLLAADLATAYYEFNHNNQKAFMAYGKDNSGTKDIFAFATVRGSVASQNAVSRLTEVFYVLDGTELKLRNISDVDAAGDKWVTKDMGTAIANSGGTAFFTNGLGTEVIGRDYYTVIPNVLDFKVAFLKKDLTSITDPATCYPYMITITLTLIDSDTVTKLKAMGESDIKSLYSDYVATPKPDTEPKHALLAKSVQTFSRSIVIDRGQYD